MALPYSRQAHLLRTERPAMHAVGRYAIRDAENHRGDPDPTRIVHNEVVGVHISAAEAARVKFESVNRFAEYHIQAQERQFSGGSAC